MYCLVLNEFFIVYQIKPFEFSIFKKDSRGSFSLKHFYDRKYGVLIIVTLCILCSKSSMYKPFLLNLTCITFLARKNFSMITHNVCENEIDCQRNLMICEQLN